MWEKSLEYMVVRGYSESKEREKSEKQKIRKLRIDLERGQDVVSGCME